MQTHSFSAIESGLFHSIYNDRLVYAHLVCRLVNKVPASGMLKSVNWMVSPSV